MLRLLARLTAVLGVALGFSAIASATEANLTVTVAGRTTTYAPASLLGMPAATSVTIPDDVAYKREMSFRAVPAASLLEGVTPDDTLRFVASDGFVATLPAAMLLARSGAIAYLAIEPGDTPWPPLKPEGGASAGPFYLVWVNPERGAHHAGAVAVPGRPHRGRRTAGQALSDDCARRCRRTTRRGADTPCSKRTARSATR